MAAKPPSLSLCPSFIPLGSFGLWALFGSCPLIMGRLIYLLKSNQFLDPAYGYSESSYVGLKTIRIERSQDFGSRLPICIFY